MDKLEAAYDENCLASIMRQKALLERAHAVITELLAYDARTMDLNKLSMLTGERTRESLAKAVISGRPNRIRWRRASRNGTLGCARTGAGTRAARRHRCAFTSLRSRSWCMPVCTASQGRAPPTA